MNLQQKAFLYTCVLFIVLLLAPSFMPKTWSLTNILNSYNTNGILTMCIVILMILPYEGKPILNFKAVAKNAVSWDIFFLVAVAIYACNAVSSDVTGIKPFLVQVLQPLLGGNLILFCNDFINICIDYQQLANNAGMAVVLMPVVAAFADQYAGVPATAICMSIAMMVFVAVLTPAASPYCAMMHAQKEYISFKQIQMLAIPICIVALLAYTFIGYPIAKILF